MADKGIVGVKIGKRVSKTAENPLGWLADVSKIPYDEPCVVYIGGDATDTDRCANGYAKEVAGVLGSLAKNVGIYAVTYEKKNVPFYQNDTMHRIASQYRHRATLFSNIKKDKLFEKVCKQPVFTDIPYINVLFDAVLANRLCDEKTGEKLPVIEACRRMRNLNIGVHCEGGFVALELDQMLSKRLKEYGYDLNEARQIQSQLLIIADAPACPLGVAKSQFISFMSVADIYQKGRENKYIFPQNTFNAYLSMRYKSDLSYEYSIYSGGLVKSEKKSDEQDNPARERFIPLNLSPCYFPKAQGNLFLIKRKMGDEISRTFINNDEHNFIGYDKRFGTDGVLMSDIKRNIWRNAVTNSLQQKEGFIPLQPIDELILSGKRNLRDNEIENFTDMVAEGKKWRLKAYQFAKKHREDIVHKYIDWNSQLFLKREE